MENYKFIKRNLLILIVILLTIFSIITFYYEEEALTIEINKKHQALEENVQKTFDVLLDDLKINIQIRMNSLLTSDDNIITKKFALRDRKGLYQALESRYKMIKLSNKHLKIMTFRLPDGSTFLRVHKPSMYGDKLNKKRKIIIDTNQLQEKHFGFEVGKLKMTYRVVLPIFHDKKYIGLVEIGIEPEYATDKINRIYQLKNALLIKKDMKSVNISQENYKTVGKDFYLARGDKIFYNHNDKIIFDIAHNHIIDNDRTYHIDSSLNLKDHKGNTAAKVLLAYDTTDSINEFNSLLQVNIVRNIILVLVLLIILNLSFNYFIDKIIGQTKQNIKHEQQLAEQSKMVSLGEMIGNIAHQWRQPLSLISTGATGMIVQKDFGILTDELLKETCNKINNNAQYLSKTIDDFKNFIKGDMEKEIFILEDTINSCINLVQSILSTNNINLILDLEKDIKINGYSNELIQCLINVINNAKDELIKKDTEKYLFITTTASDKNVTIAIKDNAGGIPEDIIHKIFEPYFTTKHQSQGTGLGLHMTYNLIVDGMNGTIAVSNQDYIYNNEKYIGAEFIINLPITA